jgi:hypothetical protein
MRAGPRDGRDEIEAAGWWLGCLVVGFRFEMCLHDGAINCGVGRGGGHTTWAADWFGFVSACGTAAMMTTTTTMTTMTGGWGVGGTIWGKG